MTLRELPDPHVPQCRWRCRDFVQEFAIVGDRWFPREFNHACGSHTGCVNVVTPERLALWRDLFTRPCDV